MRPEKLDPAYVKDLAELAGSVTTVQATDPNSLEIDFGDSIDKVLKLTPDTMDMSVQGIASTGANRVLFSEDMPWRDKAMELNERGIGVAITLAHAMDPQDKATCLRVFMGVMQDAPSAVVSHGAVDWWDRNSWPPFGEEVNLLDGIHGAIQAGAQMPPYFESRPNTPRPDIIIESSEALEVCQRIMKEEARVAVARAAEAESVVAPRYDTPNPMHELPFGGSRIGILRALEDDQLADHAPEVVAQRFDDTAYTLIPERPFRVA